MRLTSCMRETALESRMRYLSPQDTARNWLTDFYASQDMSGPVSLPGFLEVQVGCGTIRQVPKENCRGKLWNLMHCVGWKRAALIQQNNFTHSVTSGRIHTQSQQSLRKLGEGLGPQTSSFLVMFLGRKSGQWVASWPDKYFALRDRKASEAVSETVTVWPSVLLSPVSSFQDRSQKLD